MASRPMSSRFCTNASSHPLHPAKSLTDNGPYSCPFITVTIIPLAFFLVPLFHETAHPFAYMAEKMRAHASHNHALSASSLFVGEPSKDYVFASGCVAALAMVAYSLVNLVLNNARDTSQPDIEIVIGYILIILGYLLLPGVGVLLVRRKRCLARNRALLMAETDTGDSQYMDAFGGKTNMMAGMFGTSQLMRDIDEVTKSVTWDSVHGDEVQCSVCLNDVEEGEQVRILRCGHAFHRTCADLWLVNGQKNSCPLCMRQVCDRRGHDMVPLAS